MTSENLKTLPDLLRLSTGALGLRATVAVEATPDDADADLLTMKASDGTLDRHGEVIAAVGWKLDDYRQNPVIQNSHQYGDILFTLGRAEKTWVQGDALMQVWRFASGINPLAKMARDMYRAKFLRASSVGFIPKRWENGSGGVPWSRRYVEQELLEVSAVGIPSNPAALAAGIKSGAIDESDVRELAGMLKHFCSRPEGTAPDARDTGPGSNLSQLLPLARALSETIKRVR